VVLRIAGASAVVRAFPGGPAQPASPDMQLGAGMVITTAGQESELAYPDGTTVQIDPGATVQLQHPSEATLSLGGATRVSRLDLRSGSVRVRVAPGARPILILAGREEFAVFRSGEGRVRLGADGMTTVVEQGSAMLASGGRWSAIPAGSYLTIGRKPTDGIRPLLPPPVFSDEECEAHGSRACAIAVTMDGSAAPVAARWQPLPAGHHPVVTLSDDPRGLHVIATQEGPESMTEFATSLEPGRYWLAVRAVGPDGVQGRPATHPLRVLRLVGEAETKVVEQGRAALLGPGKRLQVEDASNIRIDEPGGFAVPDPGNLALRGNEMKRALRFGLASNPGQHAWFTLVRRTRTADVAISPGTAVWPRDAVQISIQMRDTAGPVPESEPPPGLLLEINGVPEKVELARAGTHWIGSVAPRYGGGPWTIRAGVFDHDGERVGHGVLHVIGRAGNQVLDATRW